MDVEQERLLSIIEFAQQSARLRIAPAATLAQHGLPVLHEDDLRGLPGITLNASGSRVDDDEIWLILDRQRETTPPEVKSATLRPWLEMDESPNAEPRLKTTTDGSSLIAAGTHRSSLKTKLTAEDKEKPAIDPRQSVVLDEYDQRASVRARFKTYVDAAWIW